MLSNQSQYAIRGVLYLAVYASETKKIGSKEVGENIDVPVPFLAKIFQKLNKKKLITSAKGPKGGFYINEDQLEGNLMAVIECIDGVDNFNSCLIGLPQCSDTSPCSIHNVVAPLRNKMLKSLMKKTISDFAKDIEKGNSNIF